MSSETANFSKKLVNYNLNIEILSIDLKSQDVKNYPSSYKVSVRFGEKSMEIIPEGYDEEDRASDGRSTKNVSQQQLSRKSTAAETSKTAPESYLTLNTGTDADDERSIHSETPRKTQKRSTSAQRSKARETSRASKGEAFRDDSSDGTNDGNRETKMHPSRETKQESTFNEKLETANDEICGSMINESRETAFKEKRETDVVKQRETASKETRDKTFDKKSETTVAEKRDKARQTKQAVESFGSAETFFEISPNCMSGLLSKHCFKYEVLIDCQLYATSNQLLNECFANSIRTEKFKAENINMKLILLDLESQNCGSMDVCITIKKVTSD